MIKVTARKFIRGLSGYIKAVESGERVVIFDRNTPIADLVSHNKNLKVPDVDKKLRAKLNVGHKDAQKLKGRFVGKA